MLTDVTFGGNQAASDGGGLVNRSSSPELDNTIFNGNWAGSAGGGMFNNYSSPKLTNVTLSGNRCAGRIEHPFRWC